MSEAEAQYVIVRLVCCVAAAARGRTAAACQCAAECLSGAGVTVEVMVEAESCACGIPGWTRAPWSTTRDTSSTAATMVGVAVVRRQSDECDHRPRAAARALVDQSDIFTILARVGARIQFRDSVLEGPISTHERSSAHARAHASESERPRPPQQVCGATSLPHRGPSRAAATAR